jgi:hypothetical protein
MVSHSVAPAEMKLALTILIGKSDATLVATYDCQTVGDCDA